MTGASDQSLSRVIDGANILSIDRPGLEAESGGPGDNISSGGFGEVSVFVVLVVFTNVDDGKLPEGGHIHQFVENALAEGAITEEADGHLIAAAHLDRHSGSSCDTGASSDDGIGAQIAGVLVGDVHGAAFSPAIAGFFAEQLGKHAVDR